MALCINQSGTWRNITTKCVKQSGTWRNVVTGCINQSGTWRRFLPALGDFYGGGYLICEASSVRWVVAPSSAEVTRTWYSRNDANTRAQQVSGCTGWFVPTCGQLQNPGYTCITYWDSYCFNQYWSSTQCSSFGAWAVYVSAGFSSVWLKTASHCVRAFRCVSY
jgi:hypothetical protein